MINPQLYKSELGIGRTLLITRSSKASGLSGIVIPVGLYRVTYIGGGGGGAKQYFGYAWAQKSGEPGAVVVRDSVLITNQAAFLASFNVGGGGAVGADGGSTGPAAGGEGGTTLAAPQAGALPAPQPDRSGLKDFIRPGSHTEPNAGQGGEGFYSGSPPTKGNNGCVYLKRLS